MRVSDYACASNTDYWSLKQNTCLPCPVNFTSNSQWPFSCYLITSGSFNHSTTSSFCASRNATLLIIKTMREFNYFKSLFGITRYWMDSRISYIGQTYLWPDGSKVYGFRNNEPNNNSGNNTFLHKGVLVLQNGAVIDANEKWTLNTTCQYGD